MEEIAMNNELLSIIRPVNGSTKYLFFGGKGGVGKTTMASATAIWFADRKYKTTIVSTDPTVSLSAVFDQEIGGTKKVPVRNVQNLYGLNINPSDAVGVFQKRLDGMMSYIGNTIGNDMTSTPCMEEMATFDQFVSFLENPDSDVIVFDTAPTGRTLRELAMPFDWAGFLQKQIRDGKKLAELLPDSMDSFEEIERDKQRYDLAMSVLCDKNKSIFNLVLLPERLPIEETQSAITGLSKLGIQVQSLVINQCISPEIIDGNRFLKSRSDLQVAYLNQISVRFPDTIKTRLPLLDGDISNLSILRKVGNLLFGNPKLLANS